MTRKIKYAFQALLTVVLLVVLIMPVLGNIFSDTYNLITLLPKLNWQTIRNLENLQRLIPPPNKIARLNSITRKAKRSQRLPTPQEIAFIQSCFPNLNHMDQTIRNAPTQDEINQFITLLKAFKSSLPLVEKLPKGIKARIPLPEAEELSALKAKLPNPKTLDFIHKQFPSFAEITYAREKAPTEYKALIPTAAQIQEWQKHIPTGNQIKAILKYLPTPEEIKKIKS